MESIFRLDKKDQEVLESFAEMIDVTKNEFARNPILKNSLSPKQTLVISMYAAVNSYSEAIYQLCKEGRGEAAIVVLRPLIEAYINSNFVLSYPNEKMLWIFAIEDTYYRRSLVNLLEDFFNRYPNQRSEMFTNQKFLEMKAKPEEELAVYKEKIGLSFKNKKAFDKVFGTLLSRAQRVDKRLKKRQKNKSGGIESTYLFPYKHFSEYTHLQMRGIEHFWKRTDLGETLFIEKNPENVGMILPTAYIIYLYFANRLKQHKLVGNLQLGKFNKFFRTKINQRSTDSAS